MNVHSNLTGHSKSLPAYEAKLFHPRFWGIWLAVGFLRLTSLLPYVGRVTVGVAIGQQIAPENRSLVTGMLMGLAWALGGFAPRWRTDRLAIDADGDIMLFEHPDGTGSSTSTVLTVHAPDREAVHRDAARELAAGAP